MWAAVSLMRKCGRGQKNRLTKRNKGTVGSSYKFLSDGAIDGAEHNFEDS